MKSAQALNTNSESLSGRQMYHMTRFEFKHKKGLCHISIYI